MIDRTIYYDPYDAEIHLDPYETFRRLRDEAPLYYNDRYDFFAVSRFADVERGLVDRRTFVSRFGDQLETIKAVRAGEVELPSGTLIFEDQPTHSIHRALVSRLFTVRQMRELEPKVRDYCRRRLDLVADQDRFDFVADLGLQLPMRVISMLLGIPESDQELVRDHFEESMRSEPGEPGVVTAIDGDMFADYIDWRYEHPSDDIMTRLLMTEFEDEHGSSRRLTRDEVLTFVTVLAGAGNETTNRVFGWIGKLLGDHPAARRELVADRALLPNAIEEVLRYEPVSQIVARYVATDVDMLGSTVPEGSVLLLLTGSANRDECVFEHADRFDIHRKIDHQLGFGFGSHFCLGASLARLEARVGLDEVLNRFPDWEVDHENARFRVISNSARGWDAMPVVVG